MKSNIVDLSHGFKEYKPRQTKIQGFFLTISPNKYFQPDDPNELKFKNYLLERGSIVLSENIIRKCIVKRGPQSDLITSESIKFLQIDSTLEKGSVKLGLHIHSNIKIEIPNVNGYIRLDYHKLNLYIANIFELERIKLWVVNYTDNSANIERYLYKMNSKF